MKWCDVIRRAERIAKESYSASDWADIVNEALDIMEPKSKVVDSVEVSLVVGQNKYDNPTTLRKVCGIVYVRANGAQANLQKLTWADRSSQGYRLPPGKIELQELTIEAGDTLLVVGPLKLPRVASTDIEEETSGEITTMIPEEWQWLIESFCVWRAQQKEWGSQDAQTEMATFFDGLEKYGSSQFMTEATGKIRRPGYY